MGFDQVDRLYCVSWLTEPIVTNGMPQSKGYSKGIPAAYDVPSRVTFREMA
jgi:hypothetical protein